MKFDRNLERKQRKKNNGDRDRVVNISVLCSEKPMKHT